MWKSLLCREDIQQCLFEHIKLFYVQKSIGSLKWGRVQGLPYLEDPYVYNNFMTSRSRRNLVVQCLEDVQVFYEGAMGLLAYYI